MRRSIKDYGRVLSLDITGFSGNATIRESQGNVWETTNLNSGFGSSGSARWQPYKMIKNKIAASISNFLIIWN